MVPAALLAVLLSHSPTTAGDVDLEALVDRAREHAKRSREAILDYSFLQHETTVVKKKSGKVVESHDRIYRVVPIEGGVVRELIQVDGREPTKKELKKNEEQNEKDLHRAARHRRAAEKDRKSKRNSKDESDDDEEEEDEDGIARLIELLSRTDYRIVGREVVAGRELIGLSFEPSVVRGEKGVTKKILKHLRGTVWLDAETGDPVRAEAGNSDRFRLKGVVGVKEFSFRLEQVRVQDELWLPKIVEVNGMASILGMKRRFESRVVFSEHSKAVATLDEEVFPHEEQALEELLDGEATGP